MSDEISQEVRRRIKLAVAAYAYEFCSESIMSDAEFDAMAKEVQPALSTARPWHTAKDKKRIAKLDKFFRESFHPDTGQWIHGHPELARVITTYERLYAERNRT